MSGTWTSGRPGAGPEARRPKPTGVSLEPTFFNSEASVSQTETLPLYETPTFDCETPPFLTPHKFPQAHFHCKHDGKHWCRGAGAEPVEEADLAEQYL